MQACPNLKESEVRRNASLPGLLDKGCSTCVANINLKEAE
jgi:hypothetical protein